MSNVQDLKEQIIKKAWADPEFKQKLLTDPRAAIKEALDIDVPDNINLNVVEETPRDFWLVIPRNPKDASEVTVAAPMWV